MKSTTPITKTAIARARACPERGHRQLVLGEWRPSPPQPHLAIYRAKSNFTTACLRVWQRGSPVAQRAVPSLWAEAWSRGEGMGKPDEDGALWASAFARNPFQLGQAHRVVAIEHTLRVRYLARQWSCRPDALAVGSDGILEALEFTSSKQPLADDDAVRTMAALDQLAMERSADMPETYRAAEVRRQVLLCNTDTFEATDVTIGAEELDTVIGDLDTLLEQLKAGLFQARPSREACGSCPFDGDCRFAWRTESDASTQAR